MFFFPYRVDLELKYIPVVTIFVCLLCTFVLYQQYANQKELNRIATHHCSQTSRFFEVILTTIPFGDSENRCERLMLSFHNAQDTSAEIDRRVNSSVGLSAFDAAESRRLVHEIVTEQYDSFAAIAPDHLTKKLWYHPKSWNPLNMVTAAFAHAGWAHLFGNLFFFFAFAAAVELIVGPLAFVGLIVGSALFTNAFYSLSSLTISSAAPTVGLSGVDMTMVAMFVFFLPTGKIRCLLWVIVFFKTFAVPAWILALAYIGFDVYRLFWVTQDSGINLVAHVSGAAFGYLVGVFWLREKRNEIQEMSYV